VWVLQEALAQPENTVLLCGDHEMPWTLLTKAVICLKNLAVQSSELFNTLEPVHRF
jgi:hypothetical protein